MLYIIVYINLRIGIDKYKGHYVFDVLDYNTGAWWNCDDDTITQYPGYPMNIYDELLINKKQKPDWKRFCMNVSDRILSMVYI